MKILIIEDVESKLDRVAAFLRIFNQDAELFYAKSVESGKEALRQEKVDLVLLDMSLPSFDEEIETKSGPPQPFGGREILGYMDHIDCLIPTIVVTMLETFGLGDNKMDADSLSIQLTNKYPEFFVGLVYYNQASDDWKGNLERHINLAIEKGE